MRVPLAAAAERRDGICLDTGVRAKAGEQRTDVRLERLEQDAVCAENVTLGCAAASRSSSTRSAFAYAVWMFMTDWIIALIFPSTLCDWSIMNATFSCRIGRRSRA